MNKKSPDSYKDYQPGAKPDTDKPAVTPTDNSKDPFAELERAGIKLPKEAQAKLADIKQKLETLKGKLVTKFDKYIMGIALLPPSRAPEMPQGAQQGMAPPGMQHPMVMAPPQGISPEGQPPQQPYNKDQINVLILVDDTDSKKMPKEELKVKLTTIIEQEAKAIDPNLAPQTLLLSELWTSCYDAKYEFLPLIAQSAPIHDTGMLAAIKLAEVHKTMVLKKFEKYIVCYVLAGSLVQGKATEKSDIDVFIVIDDTDVKRMTRAELKDKLRAIIVGMGIETGELTGIRNKLNIQVYILTDFWDSIKEANPIIFTFLRDGVPFYDRGIFMPWKQLLQMGRVKPSMEAIDMYMSTGEQMLKRVRFKLNEIGMEDTFWAILTPSQAALMLYGVPPPTPKETPNIMRELFVKKEGLLEEEYVKILERNIQVRKDLEHGEKLNIGGKEVDELLADSDRYLKRIDKLFKQIEKMKEEETMVGVYETCVTMIRDVLRSEGKERVDDAELVKIFEQELISEGKIPAKFLRVLNMIIKAKKDHDEHKLTKAEIDKVKKEADGFIRFLLEYLQRKRGRELERTRIRVKHGERYGEVILLDKEAFIIHDIDHKDKEVSKATITERGSLTDVRPSNLEEMEKALSSIVIPAKVFIKSPIFDDLKGIFGKDVEVLINY